MTDSAELWGDATFTHRLTELTWMAALPVLLHLNERATGHPARDWLTAWAPRYMPGHDLRVLVLGCGEGWLERALAQRDYIAHIDACDFASDAVERARALAPAKVDYYVLDLNHDTIYGQYDVIIAHAVLHHVENLEHAFAQIERALKPEGTLLVNEYVGPNRFQFSGDALHIENELLRALPPRLRRSAMTGYTYESRQRPTVEEMIHNDPSEAVRAEELLPMIDERFHVIDRRDLGGTIAQHLLYDIILNFVFEDPVARSLLEMILTFEAALIDERRLCSDFDIVAARKKGAPAIHERTVALPPLPPEAVGWRPSASHWLLRLLGIARLAGDPYRPTLNPPPPRGRATWEYVLGHAGGDRDIQAMLEAMHACIKSRNEEPAALDQVRGSD